MKCLRLWAVCIFMMLASTASAYAAQSSSPTFQVNEVEFGSGGQLNSSSATYRAQQSLGSTAVGSASSATYGAEAGFLTANEPFLEMVVTPSSLNLGTLSSLTPATGTASFSVRAYVNSGYTVLSVNNPPVSENGNFLATSSTQTASTPGNEQFGINLVQNLTSCSPASPVNFGADPVLVPNSAFATGGAAAGYDDCGLFKYVKGDVVAQTNQRGWGQTNYTISYLVNINSVSRAGKYTMTQDLVAVATF